MTDKFEATPRFAQAPPNFERINNKIILRTDTDIAHTFSVAQTVDLSAFPKGDSQFTEAIDINDLSQFATAAREGLRPEKLPKKIESTRNPEVKAYLERAKETGKIYPISGKILPAEVYHAGCSIYLTPDGKPVNKLEQMKTMGKYGSETRVSYFGIDPYDALNHGLGNYNEVTKRGSANPEASVLLMTIDTRALLQKRNVFIDPESLLSAFQHEFNKNFFVHSGIPVSAIKKVEILKYEGFLRQNV